MECSICGISGKLRNVSNVLSPKGVVPVCDRCAREEGFIVLRKPKPVEETKKETMYQRMARLSGVVPKELRETPIEKELQEKSLRQIIDRNYEEKIKRESFVLKPRQDLVENFHWVIMRIRRVKGLTQKQLAERVQESESAIKMAEQGVVPEGYKLIDKLERFLNVRLIRERQIFSQAQKTIKEMPFDKEALNSLTIADLQRMKKEKEARHERIEDTKEDLPEESADKEIEDPEMFDFRNYKRLDYE